MRDKEHGFIDGGIRVLAREIFGELLGLAWAVVTEAVRR